MPKNLTGPLSRVSIISVNNFPVDNDTVYPLRALARIEEGILLERYWMTETSMILEKMPKNAMGKISKPELIKRFKRKLKKI